MLKKQPIAAKKARAAKRAPVPRFAKKAAPAAKKAVVRSGTGVAVSFAKVNGYAVFGSPVRPAHRTSEQIAEAVAELS
jgi:hypothetical protein